MLSTVILSSCFFFLHEAIIWPNLLFFPRDTVQVSRSYIVRSRNLVGDKGTSTSNATSWLEPSVTNDIYQAGTKVPHCMGGRIPDFDGRVKVEIK